MADPVPPHVIEQVRQLRSVQKMPFGAIAKVMGRTKNSIVNICYRYGIQGPGPLPRKTEGTKAAKGRDRTINVQQLRKRRAISAGIGNRTDLVSLLDLTPTMCRWPLGDPKAKGFGFCGKDIHRKSYCAEHYAEAFFTIGLVRKEAA